ncbi:MAG: hypothetical protein LH650_12020 [Chloroflexi bacterium]|nr:hypothetical protein [Chloroflexota bacterium]
MATWWGGKSRQFRRHLAGNVSPAERTELGSWLTPAQMSLFDQMHPADQRHGLDVVVALRADGHEAPDLLLAGLFHDASKGPRTRLWHRVAWSLGERYGSWVWSALRPLPGFGSAFDRIRTHPSDSALLAQAAGCSRATAELIRHQSAPRDPVAGEWLRVADEAS